MASISRSEPSSQIRWGTRLAPWVAWLVPRVTRVRSSMPWQQQPLPIETWCAVADGLHNLTTDLTFWRGEYYLVHSSSPWHMASTDSRIVIWASRDARTWERVAEVSIPGGDIRDPKLAVIGDRLFLYVLRNDQLVAEPCSTAFSVSDDGRRWAPLRPCGPDGWLFWRPKRGADGRWFVPAYWRDHGKSILLASDDGIAWTEIAQIHEGDRNDETDLEFLPDGRALATARLEISDSMFGDDGACTLVATAEPPYTRWTSTRCTTTRLDGPNLFSYGGEVFAVGRRHRRTRGRFNKRAGFLGRKRTGLYHVDATGLVHLADLPSSGDTSYAGVVLRGDELTICYYTNDPATDPSWFVGMFLPSEIRIARLSMANLARLARERRAMNTLGAT
jgi:hypothetical protein